MLRSKTARMALSALLVLACASCDKKEAESGGAAATGSAAAATPTAKATATAAAAANLPVKGPWDAVKISFTKKDADGSPHFKIENTGSKTVTVLFVDYWAYDTKGKQVAHKDLGYNRDLAGGASDDISTSTVPNADTWEATYHGIEFQGDAKPTTDDKRAPAQRPKGAP